jgi:hypothetical protein
LRTARIKLRQSAKETQPNRPAFFVLQIDGKSIHFISLCSETLRREIKSAHSEEERDIIPFLPFDKNSVDK